jgi:hypothetical protein
MHRLAGSGIECLFFLHIPAKRYSWHHAQRLTTRLADELVIHTEMARNLKFLNRLSHLPGDFKIHRHPHRDGT